MNTEPRNTRSPETLTRKQKIARRFLAPLAIAAAGMGVAGAVAHNAFQDDEPQPSPIAEKTVTVMVSGEFGDSESD